MDAKRLKEAFQRLEALDERLTYKVRPRSTALRVPTTEQVNAKMSDLADYTIELKEIMREFMLAFARVKKPGE